MKVKARLQRALQILEDAECVEMLSDIERDILLTELREAYAELKYSDERRKTRDERQSNVEEKSAEELPIAPIAPITPTEEEQDEEQDETEPEVEVELIFNEEEDEETENGKRRTESGKRRGCRGASCRVSRGACCRDSCRGARSYREARS